MLTLRVKIYNGEKPIYFPFCITHFIISYDTITMLLCDGLLMRFHPLPDSECLESRDGMYSCISGTEQWSWNIVKVKVLVAQSCQILCDPMDCSPQGSSVHGILQARILEWVATPFSRESFDSEIKPGSPALQADLLSHQGSPMRSASYMLGWNLCASLPLNLGPEILRCLSSALLPSNSLTNVLLNIYSCYQCPALWFR